ncbi:MAG: glycoside hydrolase family 5 protein [Candidatus Omnitrophica bacterium]|nr:glycoside hydrolase family 5 protein [Candidatus Omnitrophota bacterium]
MARLPLLKVRGTDIVDETGRPVHLKGVALGGWLLMEGYMFCGRLIPERTFREEFEKARGREALAEFTRAFRDTFIQESDIRTIKEWGANCVRVPFNYRLVEFEDRPFSLNEEGLGYLDRVVEWCEKYGLYCILDMHAAPGGQNPDWHADCASPEFFSNSFNIDRYLRLWYFLADRYSGSTAVAGYDVLNEPVVKLHEERLIKDVYEKVTKEIRNADTKHIIFLEGNNWAQRLGFLGTPKDRNTAYSVHMYAPSDYVFNWEIDLAYPGKVYNMMWDKKTLESIAEPYKDFIDMHKVPLYVGEFGINWRGGHYGELQWVRDVVEIFDKHRFHWTYWTYKTVANATYPDGIYRYLKNAPWIDRHGPVTGWENFPRLWQKDKKHIIASWKTDNFILNERLFSVLRNRFK